MKIQVTQTLPNGQVTQQVLSKDGAEVLKIQAQPGAKISFNVEGAKPADAANAKAKTGNIKKSGDNLVLESEGEALVEVTDFYSTAGASVGDVGWNYAAADAGVSATTPEAQALSSDAAVSESGALFPAIAPGWLVAGGAATVAAVASGGGSSVASVGATVISGTVMMGPVKATNGLSVTLYKSDGTELATTTVGADGKFTASYSAAYTGVVMARVKDTTAGADYRDEATHSDKDLTSDIRALFSTTGAGTTNITLSALSEMAVRQILGDSGGDNGSSAVSAGANTAAQITAKNAALAVSLGLTGNVVTDFVINPTVHADGTAATPNAAGLIVAALSGLDAIYGSTAAALDMLTATGIAAAAVVDLVVLGAQEAGVLSALSTDVPAVGTAATAAANTAGAITTSSLDSTTIAALSPLVLAKIDPAQIGSIPDTAMAGLTVAQLAALTTAQVGAITSTQIDNLTAAQITALGADVGSLSAAAVASLDAAQVQALSAAQLNALATVSAPTSGAALSNDATPTLTGTFTGNLPTGAEIHVYDGTTDLGAATVTVVGSTWSFTPTALLTAQGAHSLTAQIQVTSGSSATASAAYVFTLDSVAPTVTADYTTNENAGTDTQVHTITLLGSDTNGPVTFSGLTGADAAKFTLTGGVLTFVGQANYEVADDMGADHVYSVSVIGTDGAGNTITQAVTVTVNNVNEAPTVAVAIADQTFVVGGVVDSFVVPVGSFTDVDAGATLTYTATLADGTALPSWLTFTPGSRTFSGNPTANGTVTVRVTASDGSLSVYDDFVITSVTAPVVQSFTMSDITGVTTKGTSGEAVTFAVTFSEAITVTGTLTAHFSVNGADVTATYTGAGGTILNFTGGTVPSTGNGNVISLTSLVGTTLGNVSGQPMVAPTAAAVTYADYTVDNTAPTITAAYTTNENAGTDTTVHTITLLGSDTNGPVTFSGLTGADAAKFSLNTSTGVLSFVGQANYEVADDAGADHVYDVSVIGTDAVGKTTTQAVSITVNNVNEAPAVAVAIADQTFVLGGAVDSFVVPVGAFADVDAGTTLTYTATLADGSALPSWLAFTPGTRTFSGNPTASGTVTVRVTASDGTLSVYDDFVITSVTAPVVQSFTMSDITGVTTKGTSGEAVTFAVTFSEAITVTGTLTAHFSVNGADVTATYTGAGGTILNFTGGTVPSTGNGNVISLTSLAGTTLGNVSGQPMVAPTAAAVTYAGYTVDNTAPTITAAYTTNENTTSDTALHTIALVGTDANGPVTFSGLTGADAAKFSLSGSTLTFVGQTNYEVADDAGADHVYDVSVIGTDAVGKTTTQAVTITVNNVNEAPAVTAPISDSTVLKSSAMSSINAAAAFVDSDSLVSGFGTLSYSFVGTPPAGVSIDPVSGLITGTPTTAGTYNLQVQASDGTNTVSDTFVLSVVTAPVLATTQTLDGVTNLDVRSALVIAFDGAIALNSSGTQHIKIYDDMNAAGWNHTASSSVLNNTIVDTYNNDVDITMTNGVITLVTVGGVDYTSRFNLSTSVVVNGNNLVIDLKPAVEANYLTVASVSPASTAFDWDFGANYHVELDAGVVTRGGVGNAALADSTTLNFTTVTPVLTTAGAVASQIMDATGAVTTLSDSYKYLNGNQGNSQATPYGATLDLSGAKYAVVLDSDGTNKSNLGGWIRLQNFSLDNAALNQTDLIYMDNHGNQALLTTNSLSVGNPSTWGNDTVITTDSIRKLNAAAGGAAMWVTLETPAVSGWTKPTNDATFENATHMNYDAIIFG
jgi:hypothetical protein